MRNPKIIAICLATLSQSAISEPSYDVVGNLQHRILLDGKLFYAQTNEFAVQVRGSLVRIRAWEFTNNENVVPVKDYVFVTDGSTGYQITTFDVNPNAVAKSQTDVGKQLRTFNAFVDVFTNTCPPNMTGNMGPVWIATASTAFMQRQGQRGGNMYAEYPVCPDWPDIGGERLKASWSLSGQLPYLPESLVEYADKGVFNVVNNFFERWKQKTFPQIYKDGFTNAVYEVLNWKNVGGLHIPSHFRLTSYLPMYDGSRASQLQVQSTYDGYIRTITTTQLDAITVSPKIPTWSRINEYRYGTIDNHPITYTSQTGDLLTKNEVLKLMRGGVQFAAKSNIIASRHRKIIWACFFCLTMLPICILLFKKFRRNA
jgi:hypothetical protein